MNVVIIETFYKNIAKKQITSSRHEDFDAGTVRNNFLADNLEAIGYTVRRVIGNVEPYLPTKLHSRGIRSLRKFEGYVAQEYAIFSRLPLLSSLLWRGTLGKFFSKMATQEQPDLVINTNLNLISSGSLRQIYPGSKIVGLIASPLPKKSLLGQYDHVFSSLVPISEEISSIEIPSSVLPSAFDAANYVDHCKPWKERDIDVVFVGSIGLHHLSTLVLLKKVKKLNPSLQIYSSAPKIFLKIAGLGPNHKGSAYGHEMLKILGRSKISINRHAWFARGYSNNKRLYESTGMGAALVTEKSKNIGDYFKEDEVFTYSNFSELAVKIRDLRQNDDLTREVAAKGRNKCLNDHSTRNRVVKMIDVISELNCQT